MTRHSRKGGNPPHHPSPHTPSFPRRRESTIPAHAGIHRPTTPTPEKTLRHSREGGNPQFPKFIVPLPQCPRKTLRHPGGNPPRACGRKPEKNTPSFPRRRESTIPAHAGIHRPITPHPRKHSVIPAKAGIHIPAHAGIHRPITPNARIIPVGNFIVPQCPRKTPRRRESTFPRMREFIVPLEKKTLRHSREGGNPQFPRMREFIVPLPRQELKIGVAARACGNSSSHFPAGMSHPQENGLRHSFRRIGMLSQGIHNSRVRPLPGNE